MRKLIFKSKYNDKKNGLLTLFNHVIKFLAFYIYLNFFMLSSEIISRNLKILRAKEGLSQKGLARMCRLSQFQISKLENNNYRNGNIPAIVMRKLKDNISFDILCNSTIADGMLAFQINEAIQMLQKIDNQLKKSLT